jgi:hypothetical protein
MVGTRRRALESSGSFYGNGNATNKNQNGYDRSDLEAAYGSINKITPRQRFRDAITNTMQDNRTAEKYRKSEESVSIYTKSYEYVH